MIFRGLIHKQHYLLLIILLSLLLFIFIGMGKRTFDMLYKKSDNEHVETEGFHIVHFASIVILLILVVTGFYMPDDMYTLIMNIAKDFGVRP